MERLNEMSPERIRLEERDGKFLVMQGERIIASATNKEAGMFALSFARTQRFVSLYSMGMQKMRDVYKMKN
jgi:hypothetical protein